MQVRNLRFVSIVMKMDFYQSPAILRKMTVMMEGSILTESIYEKVTVETTGHEVKNFDWSNEQFFNHTWE